MTLRPFLDVLTAQTGEVVSDPSNQRIVTAVVAGLVLLGMVVVGVTVWFWRSTRPEPAALAPLEEMSRRGFRQLPDDTQKERLDAVRLAMAEEAPADAATPPAQEAEPRDDTRPIDPLLAPPPPVP
jgi:FtsZ-interacting cell division protein ZipA